MDERHDSRQFVLLVDDDPSILALLQFVLGNAGIPTESVASGSEALRSFESNLPSAVVLDLGLPDMDGEDVLAKIRAEHPELPVVVVTGSDDVGTAVRCIQTGATDFLQKPFEDTRLLASVRSAHERGLLQARITRLERELPAKGLAAIIGESKVIQRTTAHLSKAIDTEVTVLLEGESGTGKELFARAVHFDSERAAGPFVVVNCAAIPESLIESELFGHQKGAFSGATHNRIGLFEQANGGTLFLDEIGELPLELQVRLLRVLQERCVRPVGANSPRPIDARIVVATNRVLADEVQAGRFRRDLFYRLSVFPVRIPNLRDRDGDIVLLAQAFLARFAQDFPGRAVGFTDEARTALAKYIWPGNVRELENVIQRAVIMESGEHIGLDSLPDEIVCAAFDENLQGAEQAQPHDSFQILPMEVEERRILERALTICAWNVREAAERLGIGRATLYRRIHSFNLKPRHNPSFEQPA